MAKSGRPRKHDPVADEISFAIESMDNDKARELISTVNIDILDREGRSPLIYAAFSGNSEITDWLIKQGANVDLQDRNGWSALHAASQNKHVQIISKLLKEGANPNLTDSHGNGPLWTASMNARGDDTIPNLLRGAGASGDHK